LKSNFNYQCNEISFQNTLNAVTAIYALLIVGKGLCSDNFAAKAGMT